jgi:hypothetical protein
MECSLCACDGGEDQSDQDSGILAIGIRRSIKSVSHFRVSMRHSYYIVTHGRSVGNRQGPPVMARSGLCTMTVLPSTSHAQAQYHAESGLYACVTSHAMDWRSRNRQAKVPSTGTESVIRGRSPGRWIRGWWSARPLSHPASPGPSRACPAPAAARREQCSKVPRGKWSSRAPRRYCAVRCTKSSSETVYIPSSARWRMQ